MDFSPKVTFSKGQYAAAWAEIASSTTFREAGSAAMLQMQANQTVALNNEYAAANHFRMEGARTFFAMLMNLTTPPEAAPPRIRTDNLDHKV